MNVEQRSPSWPHAVYNCTGRNSASAYRAGAVLEKPTLSVGSVSIISIAAGTKIGMLTVLITIS